MHEINQEIVNELVNYSLNEIKPTHKKYMELCQDIADFRKWYNNIATINSGTSFEYAIWRREADILRDEFVKEFPWRTDVADINFLTMSVLTNELRILYADVIARRMEAVKELKNVRR